MPSYLNYFVGIVCIFLPTLRAQTSFECRWKRRPAYQFTSFYFPASDGTRLAVDIHLPGKKILKKKGGRLPVVFYLTRYVRSLQLKWPYRWLKNPYFGQVSEREIRYFNQHGYAVVIMDARGSGASFGRRDMDFSEQELRDAAELLDWLVKQPWCNGRVGTTGVSYVGTTAELMLATGHPALKACAPRSNIFDMYADMVFPGGVRQGPFINVWGATTRALDRSDFSFFGGKAARFVRSAFPVLCRGGRRLLEEALRQHAENYDVYEELKRVQCRDERHPILQVPLNSFSVHDRLERIISSGVPIFRIGGWYDGALSSSVVKGLWLNPNTRFVLLGPWDHGPRDVASPYAASPLIKENILEQVRLFFDAMLKGDSSGIRSWPRVRFYNVGRERWFSASCWPIADSVLTWFLSADSQLVTTSDRAQPGLLSYEVDYSAHTGGGSRWNSLTQAYRYMPHTGYPERALQIRRNLVFRSTPLSDSLWIDGHIQVRVPMVFTDRDPQVFVYLDEIDTAGQVRYVTEGMLRLAHRRAQGAAPSPHTVSVAEELFTKERFKPLEPGEKEWLTLELLPISYTVPKGHQLLLSFAGADAAHFDNTVNRPDQFFFDLQQKGQALLEIPIVKPKTLLETPTGTIPSQ
ncbi:MAG: CocE/NonD family hydrolase [Flavobacteriales bacterium]|nr:CocE/NonD family hydrolase [Flavobacteriales bacterium]MCX7769205.1 CocE/NonD family hydrolase [Flavobacteriales bacterium]MDW8410615.1 CocE/NonD family hydrolase [Flavobacteriales bacterium]